MNKALPILYTSWCGLGFIRGINSYHYHHMTYEKDTYLYLHAFGYGCCGLFLYANPLLIPFSVYKEIYRVEVNVRKLEHEKKGFYYNLF
jgi:hypothetical protein